MAKKELKTEYKIVVTHGSEFQEEVNDGFIKATLLALAMSIEQKHKKNNFKYLIKKHGK